MASGRKYVLMCAPKGGLSQDAFSVEVHDVDTIATLKLRIQQSASLLEVPASEIAIWKVTIPFTDYSRLEKEAIDSVDPGARQLQPLDIISQVFRTELALHCIHIVFTAPGSKRPIVDVDGEEADVNSTTVYRKLSVQSLLPRVRNLAAIWISKAKANPFTTVGVLPVDPRTPEPEIVMAAANLMSVASVIYRDEKDRKACLKPELTKVLSIAMIGHVNADLTTADGTIIETLRGNIRETAATCISKEKNEFGDGGSDPSIQAGLSYCRLWAQGDHTEIRENSCCPTFLLASAGASFAVLGAVWTDKIVVQRLTDFMWIAHDTMFNDPSIHRIARVFYSLGRNIRKLGEFYQTVTKLELLDENILHPRFFPSVCAYRNEATQEIINFTFIEPLEPDSVCVTFLAQEKSTSRYIVVKFVHRYNATAHRLLAKRCMAPQLHYHGKIGIHDDDPSYGHLRMVVMDYVDGSTIHQLKKQNPKLHYR